MILTPIPFFFQARLKIATSPQAINISPLTREFTENFSNFRKFSAKEKCQ
jgi:hypothetical protein